MCHSNDKEQYTDSKFQHNMDLSDIKLAKLSYHGMLVLIINLWFISLHVHYTKQLRI